MPLLRPFERLVTRLVYRDAAEAYGAVVLAVAFAAIFVGRAWPPPQIRAALVDAEVGTRAAILAAALAAYLLGTRAAIGLLLGSARLAYLRHLPVARGRWRRLHLAHLVAVNLPWAGVVAYGLAGPPVAGGLGPLGRGLVGFAWVMITLAAQADAVYAARAGRRLLGLGAALAGAAVVLLAATPMSMVALAVVLSASALGHLWRQLGAPPPEPDGSVRRWFVGRRGAGRRRPVAALLRVEGLALARRGPASLRRHLGFVGGCVTIAALAIAAAVNAGQAPDPGLVRAMLITGAIAGAHLSVVAARLIDRDRWYLDALPLGSRAILRGRLFAALLGAAPASAGVAAAAVGIAGGPPLEVTAEALCVAGVAAAWMTWAGLRAEARRQLHARVLLAPALAGIVALALLMAVGGWASLGLLAVEAALGVVAAAGQVGPATRARRRLETSRRDDDHAAA